MDDVGDVLGQGDAEAIMMYGPFGRVEFDGVGANCLLRIERPLEERPGGWPKQPAGRCRSKCLRYVSVEKPSCALSNPFGNEADPRCGKNRRILDSRHSFGCSNRLRKKRTMLFGFAR